MEVDEKTAMLVGAVDTPKDSATETIIRLKKQGRNVVMITGDNRKAAESVAQESGGVVLVKDDLRDVARTFELSCYTMRKIKQNLFWAFFYNSIGIPVAAGVLYPFFGFMLNPIIAGAAMAFSSVSVVSNSLSMRRFRLRD